MINMSLDTTAGDRAAEMIGATEAQVKRATRRAMKTVIKTAANDVKRDVSTKANISQKRLGVRVKRYHYDDDEAVLWFGADPVDVASLGRIKWNNRSAGAGKITRRGAFKANMGYGTKVFIRAASKHFRQDHFTEAQYGQNIKKSRWGSPASRFPLHRAIVHIDDEVETAINSLDGNMQDLFDRRMQAELNYEINVAGKR